MVDDPLAVQSSQKTTVNETSIIAWDPFKVKPPDKPKEKKNLNLKKVTPKPKKSASNTL